VVVVWLASSVFLVLFAGLLLGVLLHGSAAWLARRAGWHYGPSLATVGVAVLLLLVGSGYFLLTSISQQLSELVDRLPEALGQVRSAVASNPLGQRVMEAISGGTESAGGDAAPLLAVATTTTESIGNVVLILFVGLYLAADPAIYRRGLVKLVTPRSRDRLSAVLEETGETLFRWLLGRIILMVEIGVLTWLGLLLMGMPLALALGVLAGALSFIPNIGPIVSAIPALLVAASIDSSQVLYVALLYLGLQTADSYLLEPYVVKRTADLPGATVFGFQVLMGTLAGVWGLIVATPLLAALAVLVNRLYVEDVLLDRPASSGHA
jgi:predicted PurR-regulated permease PerM